MFQHDRNASHVNFTFYSNWEYLQIPTTKKQKRARKGQKKEEKKKTKRQILYDLTNNTFPYFRNKK